MNQHAYILALLFICLDTFTMQLQQHKEEVTPHNPRQYRLQKYLPQSSFPDYGGDDTMDYSAGDQQNARNVVWDAASRLQTRINDFIPSAAGLLQGSTQQKTVTPRHSTLSVVENWPTSQKRMGQLSAVDVDKYGGVHVFHRGDRKWTIDTFSMDNKYLHKDLGPIKENTIVVFNSSTGEVVMEWGSGMFYMPHGLTVDFEDNVWVTDVALHQVFKFPRGGRQQPLLSLGVPFKPANDRKHFCKPTDVAVMKSNGDFFVSDGYCNSRIIKYSKNGTWLLQWGRNSFVIAPSYQQYSFNVPHALALVEEKQLVCVADRENGRVACYNCHNTSFVMEIKSKNIGSKIYSLAYTPAEGGLLYLVNSPEKSHGASGFSVNITSGEIVEQFPIGGDLYAQPHDIAVSAGGGQVYVVELSGYKVWKFVKDDVNGSNSEVAKNTSENALPTAAASLSQNSPNNEVFNVNKSKGDGQLHHTDKELTSITTALGVILGATAVVGIAVLVVLFKLKRKGCMSGGYSEHRDRWEFPIPPVEGFKFTQFLDRHQGFEKVSTEESDDEGASGNTNIPMAMQRVHYA